MRTLAITVNKGGVGKTTLTKSIATAAAVAGFTVLILDMDTQQNSTNWGRRRVEQNRGKLPVVRFTTEGDLAAELKRAEEADCDLVVIDTPPGRGAEAPAAIEAADLVLIPFVADDVDSFDGIPRTARLARMEGKPAFAFLNCATPGSKVQEETAKAVMAAIGIPLAPVFLHRFSMHRDANQKGATAQELDPVNKAAIESLALWEWVRAELQLGTSALVHKVA